MGIGSLVNPAFGAVYSGSQLVGTLMNAITGQGIFGPTPLPFTERGLNWSAAENAASQVSKMTGIKGAERLLEVIKQTNDPTMLLHLAALGRDPSAEGNTRLAPHGEIQFFHPGYPQPEQFQAVVRRIMETGDQNLLRDFISGVSIQTGESGATKHDFALTDWYRRQLVSLLPASSSLRQDMTGLFAPVPQSYLGPLQQMAGIGDTRFSSGAQLPFGLSPEDLRGDLGGIYTQPLLSAFGRTPAEYQQLQQLHTKAQAAYTSPDLAQYVDRQTYPGYYGGVDQPPVPWPSQVLAPPPEPTPGTPEWYAKYVPL